MSLITKEPSVQNQKDSSQTNLISKESFKLYESIRRSGATNMADIRRVVVLSDFLLTREECLDIMKNYSKYEEKYANQ